MWWSCGWGLWWAVCVRATCDGELCVWGELCGGSCAGSCVGESCVASCVGGLWGDCVGSWGAVCGVVVRVVCAWGADTCTPVTRWSGHAHIIPSSTPSTRGIPNFPPTNCPPSCPCPSISAHSSSQVVHCRVCPPHPLHAPVLVLHLAVYPASPTQGRVGFTDRLTHSTHDIVHATWPD